MKVISDKSTGRLLGAQVVGEKGVDKRIDVFATALAAGLRVSDLENLDLAYAPQFSSAKDPVIIAGFVASNVTRQETRVIRCEELRGRLARHEPIQLIDVRTPAEFAAGHLDGAFSLPLDELRDRIHELDSTKETVVYCKVGLRGYLAARILQQSGFGNVQNLTGGLSICPDPSGPSAPSTLDGATVSVQVLRERIGLPFVVVLDVRENDEYAYEHIAGTQNFPLSQLAQWSQKVSDDKELYVFCQSGVRTQQAITSLRSQGFRRLHAVEGGLNAWKAARFPVQKRRGPIPIMRQVQIVAGAIAFLGGVIPGFHWIAALVGAGLVFAGLSGHCGLAWVLGHLPWNKTRPLTVGAPGGCGNGPSRRC